MRFGNQCEKTCGHCALGNPWCDLQSGDCFGKCQFGWIGTDCQWRINETNGKQMIIIISYVGSIILSLFFTYRFLEG